MRTPGRICRPNMHDSRATTAAKHREGDMAGENGYDTHFLQDFENSVPPGCECPNCGENDADLVFGGRVFALLLGNPRLRAGNGRASQQYHARARHPAFPNDAEWAVDRNMSSTFE